MDLVHGEQWEGGGGRHVSPLIFELDAVRALVSVAAGLDAARSIPDPASAVVVVVAPRRVVPPTLLPQNPPPLLLHGTGVEDRVEVHVHEVVEVGLVAARHLREYAFS